MCVRIILCPELDGGLHGDVCFMGKAMAAIRGRGAVTCVTVRFRVGLWFDLNHPADTGAEKQEINTL